MIQFKWLAAVAVAAAGWAAWVQAQAQIPASNYRRNAPARGTAAPATAKTTASETASAAAPRGDTSRGCRLLQRVRELWSGAEPGLPAHGLADSLARACP